MVIYAKCMLIELKRAGHLGYGTDTINLIIFLLNLYSKHAVHY